MKKLILLLTLTLTTFSYSQTDSLPSVDITTAERIIDKYSSKISDSFNEGLNKITPVAEEGFKIAVKLQIAKGIIYCIPIIVFIIFLNLFLKEYRRLENILNSENVPNNMDSDYGPFNEDNLTSIMIVYLVISIILFIMSLALTYDGVTHLVAPEWFAIKEIIELF